MGVYIKDMEMPKSCTFCCLEREIFGWDGDGEPWVAAHQCPIAYPGYTDKCRDTMRLRNCPLVPVPPHGRLIDADAYTAEMKKRQDACAEWRKKVKKSNDTEMYYRADGALTAFCESKLTFENMHTIIPAEEEKHEERRISTEQDEKH